MENFGSKFVKILVVICSCVSLILCFKVVSAESENKTFIIGRTIYVDAGHGGNDNGASFEGVYEDEINLKIAEYVIENLINLGGQVFVSRTSDYDLSSLYDKNKKRNDLKKRVKQINDINPDLFVSIHLNSYASQDISGAQVFFQNDDNSKMLANSIQDNLNVLCEKKRKAKLGDYYILNKSNLTGVIVECGFLSNYEERDKLVNESYQKKIANRITQGIVNYFNNLDN